MHLRSRSFIAVLLAAAAASIAALTLANGAPPPPAAVTPIHHVVVIFDENQSFDHYFGTYPNATNPVGDPAFTAAVGTPASDNYVAHPGLLAVGPGVNDNHNVDAPQRLPRSAAVTCDQGHGYSDEQKAANGGAMDKFEQFTAGGGCSDKSIVMDYYDGNTVTGLWNLAQHYAMSDNFFGTGYGPSTPGALNLISGNTNGANAGGGVENGSVIGDPNPIGDDCGNGSATMTGTNIGDQMNAAGVTWGWFQGGFKPTSVDGSGTATCGTTHTNVAGGGSADYSAHHEPFQYYASTANPHHVPPSSVAAIGTTDAANHQYDLTDFDAAIQSGNLPQVSFLKAASFEDAHPGSSGPLDEQRFIARVLDEVQQSSHWASTAVIIAYDDSDGWYDHRFAPVTHTSNGMSDQAVCAGPPVPVVADLGRCGPGPRLPFLVVSPWAKPNYVDHTLLDQTSIIKFIEFNWGVPAIGGNSYDASAGDMKGLFDFVGATRQPATYLDPTTGQVLGGPPAIIGSAPPQPAPTTSVTPPPSTSVTPPPTTTQTTPKPPTKTYKAKLSFTSKRTSKSLALSMTVTGLNPAKSAGAVTVSVKFTRGKVTIATGKGTVKSGKLKVTLKFKKALKKGRYTIAVTVTQAHKSTKFSKTLTVK